MGMLVVWPQCLCIMLLKLQNVDNGDKALILMVPAQSHAASFVFVSSTVTTLDI